MAVTWYSKAGADTAFTRRMFVRKDLREWAEAHNIYDNENGDNTALFAQVMADLRGLYNTLGAIHECVVPPGRFVSQTRLSPPEGPAGTLGGYFGWAGASKSSTVFLPVTKAWFGMNQHIMGDPDWSWEHMYFRDFTIDGRLQQLGTQYDSGMKGLIMHNFRETSFYDVDINNTLATAFGLDYARALLVRCGGRNAGRGRRVFTPNPEDGYGSGAIFGFGVGQKPDERYVLRDVYGFDGGGPALFGEQLGQPESQSRHNSGIDLVGGVFRGCTIGINDAGTVGSTYSNFEVTDNTYAGIRVGESNPSMPGGESASFSHGVSSRNRHGAVIEGGGKNLMIDETVEITLNTGQGLWYRDRLRQPTGEGSRISAYVHHNGGAGVLSDEGVPLIDVDFSGLRSNDNGTNPAEPHGGGIEILGPSFRPRLIGTETRRNRGVGTAFWGPAPIEPIIQFSDFDGSPAGDLLFAQDVADASRIGNNKLNPASVTMSIPNSGPFADAADWLAESAVGTFEVGTGPDFGNGPTNCYKVVKSGAIEVPGRAFSPNLIAGSFAPGMIGREAIYMKAPAGTSISMTIRLTSPLRYIRATVVRASGQWQELEMPFTPVSSFGNLRVGVTITAPDGTVVRIAAANHTKGGIKWPRISGELPNCSWVGTPFTSASVLTPLPPAPTMQTVPGLWMARRASVLTGATGSSVASWPDEITTAPAAVVSPSRTAPTLQSDGSGKFVRSSSAASMVIPGLDNYTGPLTVYVRGRAGAATGNRYFIDAYGDDSSGADHPLHMAIRRDSASGAWQAVRHAAIGTTVSDTGLHIIKAAFNGTTSTIQVDAAEEEGGTTNTGLPIEAIRLFARADDTTLTTMDLYGFVVVKGTVTAANDAIIRAWLAV